MVTVKTEEAYATAAIAIAFATGGTAVLTSTRDDYEIVEQNSKHIILKRR